MIHIDEHSARLLMKAIDDMKGKENIDIAVLDHPLVRLQRLAPIQLKEGSGYTYSIGQLHRLQPVSYESRMILILIDQRNPSTGAGPITVFPVSYHDEVNGVEEIAAWLSNGQVKKYDATIQRALAAYARSWLGELHTAGYF